MKICAYVVNGTPVCELGKYLKSDLNSNDPYIVIGNSDTVPTGYQDISSILHWWDFGTSAGKDYKYIRNEIMILAAVTGWANLTLAEKIKAAEIFSVGDTERLEIYTLEQQIQLGMQHHVRSMESRQIRLMTVQMNLFNRLSKADWEEVGNAAAPYLAVYLEQGREGTSEGDPEGLFDYVDGSARPGTSWTTNGFRDKNYTIEGYASCSDFADYLLGILKDGNY